MGILSDSHIGIFVGINLDCFERNKERLIDVLDTI